MLVISAQNYLDNIKKYNREEDSTEEIKIINSHIEEMYDNYNGDTSSFVVKVSTSLLNNIQLLKKDYTSKGWKVKLDEKWFVLYLDKSIKTVYSFSNNNRYDIHNVMNKYKKQRKDFKKKKTYIEIRELEREIIKRINILNNRYYKVSKKDLIVKYTIRFLDQDQITYISNLYKTAGWKVSIFNKNHNHTFILTPIN